MDAPNFFDIQKVIGSDAAINFYLVNAGIRKGYLEYLTFKNEELRLKRQQLIKNIIKKKYNNLAIHINGISNTDTGRFVLEYIICGKEYYDYVKETFNNHSRNKSLEIGAFLGYLTPYDFNKVKKNLNIVLYLN